jgi:hypothetical protein
MTPPFDFTMIEHLFPDYLTATEKGRLLQALEQFKDAFTKGKWNSKVYSHFYPPSTALKNFILKTYVPESEQPSEYFLQGDLIQEIRYPNWNSESKNFERTYTDALILSNTCDLDLSNLRKAHKQVVLAPIVEMSQYVEEISDKQESQQMVKSIKSQTTSNILYLPPNLVNGKDYICHLDKAFWFPTEELNSYIPDIAQTRIASLDYFGYYLFLVKLSYHFCRLPEEKQR